MAVSINLKAFARNLLRGSRRRNIFLYFRFYIGPGTRALRLISQHTRLRRFLEQGYNFSENLTDLLRMNISRLNIKEIQRL